MSSGSSPAQTNQVSKVELPEWVNQASQSNYKLATDIANRPLDQYQGQQVAGPGAMTTQGYDYIKSLIGQNDPLYQQATGLLTKAAGYQDRASPLYDKQAATLDATAPLYNKATGAYDAARGVQGEAADIYRSTAGPLDINQFLNPYTGEVEQRSIANAQREADRQQLATADATRRAGGFGGSRGEIESALTRSEGIRGIGDLTAKLRKEGIDFATNTAIADRAGRQAAGAGLLGVGQGYQGTGAGYGNVAAGLQNTAAGYGNTAAGLLGAGTAAGQTAAGLGNLAATRAAEGQQNVGNLLTAGAQQKQQQQEEINALMKQFYEKRDYPLEGLNTRLAALGMSPYGRTETTNKTATSEDKGPDWASILLGIGGLGIQGAKAGLFSDRRAKTDIEKLSDGPIPMYAYRYKSDPKSYPKIVGPMAQDIEKIAPSAVKKVGKYKTIDLNNLMEVLS